MDSVRGKNKPNNNTENYNNNNNNTTSREGEESLSQKKKSVSWGVNAVLELVPTTIGFVSSVVSGASRDTANNASAGVVTGSYQRLSTHVEDVEEDEDEAGQSSFFLGDSPSADKFRL